MSFAAFSIFAVSSTSDGGFPSPAAMTFFPLLIACRTTPGPPVIASNGTSGCSIISFAASIEGSVIVTIRF